LIVSSIVFTLFDVTARELSSAKSTVTLKRESAISFKYIKRKKEVHGPSLGGTPSYIYLDKEKEVLTRTF
jgi:hypothetical protein